MAFGCGIYNERFVAWENDTRGDPISGVVGLGKYDLSSILYQLSPITLLKFSYCLPLHIFGDHDHHHDHALLAFGNDADIRGTSGVQTTPIYGTDDDCYYLNLTGISFDGKILPIDPKRFMTDNLGVIVDSGTPYTLLDQEAYDHLRQDVVTYFLERYEWSPLDQPRSNFNLCYPMMEDIQGLGNFAFPKITFRFEGPANLELKEASIFQIFEIVNEFCFMVLPSYSTNILGGFQQIHHRFLFDVGASKLSFAPENC
ncbi:PREDICTED: aspartic proteinase CDR1-like [Fragaria vesca subsp. vesca]|uniref:aspartic proteinase CDR1-like n=1 Tax=Fragaria vesca subsp. vesca TaxID=101020 RepID=UPI0002C2F90E|nr:PREDICTED: aspartic proteinase CDR1-like [Fragaria vesca subsp. vesca]